MRSFSLLVGSLLAVCPVTFGAEPPDAAELFVSPDGNDANAGTQAEPFATIRRAKRAVRKRVREGLDESVTVLLREGTYRLERPLVFGPEDSGTEAHAVSYAAFPGERVVVSGGRRITGWERVSGGLWRAEVTSGWSFRNLFVDGRRAIRARTPNASDDPPYVKLTAASLSDDRSTYTLRVSPDQLQDWDAKEMEVAVFGNWAMNRLPVERIDPTKGRIVLAPPHAKGHRSTRPREGRWAYFENARGMLDAPGEWYLDQAEGLLYYKPREGENLDAATVVAPVAKRLIEIEGTPESPVRNLHFERLRLMHTAWALPDAGYMGIQATHYTIGQDWHRPWGRVPAAVRLRRTRGTSVEEGVIAHTGGSAIELVGDCRGDAVRGNHIHDIAANGVMVGGPNKKVKAPEEIVISNNHVHACGRVLAGAVGIWVGFAKGTSVEHNHVHDLPYTGISVGWQWNPRPTPCRENRIAANHIHDVVRRLCDGGGIYTLGLQPGTAIVGNSIHDIPRSRYAQGAPNNGIFFDQGSKGYRVEGNAIHGTSGAPIRFNQSKRSWHTWANNRFGKEAGARNAPAVEEAGLQRRFR